MSHFEEISVYWDCFWFQCFSSDEIFSWTCLESIGGINYEMDWNGDLIRIGLLVLLVHVETKPQYSFSGSVWALGTIDWKQGNSHGPWGLQSTWRIHETSGSLRHYCQVKIWHHPAGLLLLEQGCNSHLAMALMLIMQNAMRATNVHFMTKLHLWKLQSRLWPSTMTPSATRGSAIDTVQDSFAMHLSMGPLPFIDTTIWPCVDSWTVLFTIQVLTFIGCATRPRHQPIASHLPWLEGSRINTSIWKLVHTFPMHLVCLKASIVGSTLGSLVKASAVFTAILEGSAIEASICPELCAKAGTLVLQPLTFVATATCFGILAHSMSPSLPPLALVDASISTFETTCTMRFSIFEASLVGATIRTLQLTFTLPYIALPLPGISRSICTQNSRLPFQTACIFITRITGLLDPWHLAKQVKASPVFLAAAGPMNFRWITGSTCDQV